MPTCTRKHKLHRAARAFLSSPHSHPRCAIIHAHCALPCAAAGRKAHAATSARSAAPACAPVPFVPRPCGQPSRSAAPSTAEYRRVPVGLWSAGVPRRAHHARAAARADGGAGVGPRRWARCDSGTSRAAQGAMRQGIARCALWRCRIILALAHSHVVACRCESGSHSRRRPSTSSTSVLRPTSSAPARHTHARRAREYSTYSTPSLAQVCGNDQHRV